MEKNFVNRVTPPDNRGTGRTTNLLIAVYDMLYEAQYPMVFFVTAHVHDFRYVAPLFMHKVCSDALYSESRKRITFRNRFGNLVHIQLVTMDNEAEATRGYKLPIAHDHYVIERRTESVIPISQQIVKEELMSRGVDPLKPIFIFK